MSTLDVDTIATDADLANELGADDALQNLVPAGWLASAKPARQTAYEDILEELRNRVPPVHESDLAVPTELRRVVTLGAIAELYLQNMTTGSNDDINANKHRHYRAEYRSRRDALRPSVSTGVKAGPRAIAFHRR